ncbi:IS21 family transposase [Bifidobacterium thermophilum]|nr:IS21 family transposase [Bifidobacterium thermophilum]
MVLTGWCLYLRQKGPERIMTGMPQVQSIRRLRRNGESVASIARKTHAGGATVRKYLAKEDLSAVPSAGKPRASAVGPYLPAVGQWLAEDRANWRRQRHTATRIWERSGDGHGAEVSLSTVTRAVARPGRGFAAERDEAFMDLVWHPGEAQADFGEVDVLLRGVVQRMHHFVPGFPYSNVGLVQSVPGGNAECTCLASRNLFEWLGGVPERIVFDNAAGVGHKGYGEREPRLTHLFQAFQAHYGFDCSFCNPYSGHERARWSPRSAWCGASCSCPRPSVWSLENFNAGLPDRCLELAAKPHYRKDTEERGLFSEDRAALLPLPGEAFSTSAAWRHMKADRYGVAALEGRHRCSADRADAGREVIVGLRALEARGSSTRRARHLATHPRAYGQASTNSEDPSMQLALLCNKPASWPNSRVRDALPDPLREWLDRQDRQTRNEALQPLKRVDRESGWANAVEAMLSILESTGGADRAGAALLAARLAEGVAGIEYDDDRPDPGEYDIASAGDAGVQGGGRRARRRTKGSTRRPASCSSPRRASTNSPAGPRPARSTPSTDCSTRNWRTGNARGTTGSCAAPGSPSSRVSTATTSRTPGSPDGYTPGRAPGTRFHPARRTWCSTARPGAERHISQSGWA